MTLAATLGVAASLSLGGLWLTAPKPVDPVAARAARAERLRRETLPDPFEALKALHQPKSPPRSHDWLAQHDEPGETLKDYLLARPQPVPAEARTLYVVRLGSFSEAEARLLDRTRDYLGLFFQTPVKELAPIDASSIVTIAQRKNPHSGNLQWHTRWILETLLPKLKPTDAAALIALTAVDLYPDPDWNFVFGQASLASPVGVWSIARHGDPDVEFNRVLLRTLKVAVHETGHMLGLPHCTAYECVMNGGNNLSETDRGPVEPCPVCLAKLVHATGLDPLKRFKALRAFLEAQGMGAEGRILEQSEKILQR